MIAESPVFTLINPQNGNLAFKFMAFNDSSSFDHVQRHNYYSLIWVKQGSGKVRADLKTMISYQIVCSPFLLTNPLFS